MNIPLETLRGAAVSNALSSVMKNRRFPHKVLVGSWADYLFFEPFVMFNPDFIEVKNLLMIAEKSSVIALINLGNGVPIEHSDSQVMFIDQHVGAKEYVSELESRGSPYSWRFFKDRYVCASDKTNWSIYCERENDVGVFAHRPDFP